MPWTYDSTQLDTNPVMQVRFEIGDTDENAPLLDDSEIERAVDIERTVLGAAARCCEVVSRQLLRKADVRIGRGTYLTYSTAAAQYTEMAKALRKRANAMNAPWAGGVDASDKTDLASDTGKVQPIFTKRTMDNPWVGGQTSESPTDDGQDDA